MRLIIADDHSLFRAALPGVLAGLTGGVRPIEAATVDEAAAALARTDVDLVLLDLFMPGMDGFEGLRRLRRAAPTAPIIVLTASSARQDADAALAAGASAYVAKSASPDALIAAISAVLDEGASPVVGVAPGSGAAHLLDRLTPRQREVSALLAEGLSNREIATALDIAEGTVKLHVASILKSVGARRRSEIPSLLARGRSTY